MPKLNETKDVDHSDRGEIIKPVDTGDTHAGRKADVKAAGEPTDLPEAPTLDRAPVATGDTHAGRKADVKSKSSMIKEAISALSKLSPADLETTLAGLAESEDEKQVTGLEEVSKSDLEDIFGSLGLSEDFKNKATLVFEANVSTLLKRKEVELEEAFDTKLTEAIEKAKEELAEKEENQVDRYLTFVVEQWAEENKIAIETGLTKQIAEEFWQGLANLFEQHSINVPTEKVDAIEALQESITDLETKLNDTNKRLIESNETLVTFKKKEIAVTLAEGLSVTQKDKFTALLETIETSSITDYEIKAKTLKESVIPLAEEVKDTSKVANELNETVTTKSTVIVEGVKPINSKRVVDSIFDTRF